MDVHTRWMICKDMPEVLAIESSSYDFPWTEEEFRRCLRQRNCIGMVGELGGEVVGYMIYELHKNRLHVRNFAVRLNSRRCGIGMSMMGKLADKLSRDHRNRIMLEVRETNLAAQLFFKRCGFRAIDVLRNFYAGTNEDAYIMQLRYSTVVEQEAGTHGTTR